MRQLDQGRLGVLSIMASDETLDLGKIRASGRSGSALRSASKAGTLVVLLLLLTGCATGAPSTGSSDATKIPPATTAPETATSEKTGATVEEVAAGVKIGSPALDAAAAEAIRCKPYLAADSVGLVRDDAALRTTADECWAHIDGFMAAAIPLGDALRPYVGDQSSPQEVADLTERTANTFYTLQLMSLSPECRVGADPDFDKCSVNFKGIFVVIQMWLDDLGPAWQAYT